MAWWLAHEVQELQKSCGQHPVATQDTEVQEFHGTSLRQWLYQLAAALDDCLKDTLMKQEGENSVVAGKSNRSSCYIKIPAVVLVARKQSDLLK